MTQEEALELLSLHAGMHPDFEHPKFATGFLRMIRPYQGHLVEDNFIEVMECIRVIGPSLHKGDLASHSAITSIWTLCHFARIWGLTRKGKLFRENDLLSDDDQTTLDEWLIMISDVTQQLLLGEKVTTAFTLYDRYLED